ncbi:MAG: PilZ domain-containing protein [Alphaproteobacteria bacterium]|jgi:hypothetical protein|nr:PilZ domain-containing protein [Alphaproteobacteria bacterium]
MSDSVGDFGPEDDQTTIERRLRRWSVDFETTLSIAGARMTCRTVDLSPNGACVVISDPHYLVSGDQLLFELPGYGGIEAEVRYKGEGFLGLMLLHDDAGEVALARYLVDVEQSRRPPRDDVGAAVRLTAGGIETTCIVEDISRIGARVLVDDIRLFTIDQEVSIEIEGIGPIAAAVQQLGDREIGLIFLQQLAGEPVLDVPAAGGRRGTG